MRTLHSDIQTWSWGDLNLKNYNYTPRIHTDNSWQNIPWPTNMQITPMGNDTYWQHQRSYNTFNGWHW
jgi:hypothetical protein